MFPRHWLRSLLVWVTSLVPALADARTEIPRAAQPQLTVANDGRVWLVYGNYLSPIAPAAMHAGHGDTATTKAAPAPERVGEIYVASSSDGGATFSTPVRVATLPRLMLGLRRGPRVAVHGDHLTVTAVGSELACFVSLDGGRHWDPPSTINEVPTSAREGLHDLAVAPSGALFVTWLDLRNGRMELWGAESRDHGRSWQRQAPVYRSPDQSICECCHPSALFDADGNLAVMWRNSVEGHRDVWMRTRRAGAGQFDVARKLGDGSWTLKACPMDGGRPVALGGGRFSAVWQRAGEIFVSDPDAPEFNLGKGKQPVTATTAGGQRWVVWQQGDDLVRARAARGAKPEIIARQARFASLVPLRESNSLLLAFEQGPAKGPTSVVVVKMTE